MFQHNELVIYFLMASTLVSSFLVRLSIMVAPRLGFVDQPVNGRTHRQAIPLLGGAAMFVTILVMTCGHLAVLWVLEPYLPAYIQKLLPHPIIPRSVSYLFIVLGGATAVFLVGLVDDRRKIAPISRLTVQILAACGIVSCGIHPDIPDMPHEITMLLTIFWIVGITNAFNLLDGIDGLCGAVATVALLIFFFYCRMTNQGLVMVLLAVLMGAVIGYLQYNWHPAKVYMGSAGSLTLGFLLACIPLLTDFFQQGTPYRMLMLPPLILSVPLYDTLSIILMRIMNGRGPLQPDRNHLHHRLLRLGLSVRQTVGVLMLLGLATGIMALLLPSATELESTVILLSVISMFSVFVLLERVNIKGADRTRRFAVPVRCRVGGASGVTFDAIARTLSQEWLVLTVSNDLLHHITSRLGEEEPFDVHVEEKSISIHVRCRLMGVLYDEENGEYTVSLAPLIGKGLTVGGFGRAIGRLTYPVRGT